MDILAEHYLQYLELTSLNEQELMEQFDTMLLESKFSKASLLKSYKTNIKAAEKFLKSYHVDIGFIKSQGKKAGEYISKKHKAGVPPKKVAKEIVDVIGKKTVGNSIAKVKKYAESKGIPLSEAVIKSIAVFIVLIWVVSIFGALGGAILSPTMALIFGACIVAPLAEEYAKRFALIGKYPFVYTGIFAGIEALLYINMGAAVLPRIIVIGVHFATTAVQKSFADKEAEEGKPHPSMTGYIVAVGMHTMWNTMAVIAELSS